MQKGLFPIAALLLLLLMLLSSITVAVDAWLLSSSSSSGSRKVSVIVRPQQQQQHRCSTMVHTSLLQARPSWFFTFRHVQPFLERIHAPSSSLSLLSPSFSVTMLRHSSRPDTDSVDDSNDMNDDDDDEELCADEEECEIDWDAMPLDETASSASSSSSSSARTRLEMQWELTEAAEDCDVEVPTSCGSEPCQECAGQGHKPCRFCHGTAVLYMRKPPSPPTASACYDIAFASTSRFGSLLPTTTTTTAQTAAVEEHTFDFSACPICQNGKEVCRSCQGTGWVASWTHWQEPAH